MRSAKRLAPAALALLLLAPSALGQQETSAPPRQPSPFGGERWTFGGYVGFGFGTVNWVSVSPEVGYFVAERLWTGASGYFQFTNDTSYTPDFNTTNYGFGLFARYFFFGRAYAAAQWNWSSVEVRSFGADASRENRSSFYLGGGYAQPLGGNTALLIEVLYDLTGNAVGLYGSPLVVQMGVTVAF
jgi:hypothetical protein